MEETLTEMETEEEEMRINLSTNLKARMLGEMVGEVSAPPHNKELGVWSLSLLSSLPLLSCFLARLLPIFLSFASILIRIQL